MKHNCEKKKLGEVAENLDNMRIPVAKNKRRKGIYPYFGASGVVDYVDKYIFDDDLLLVSEDGANLLARTYPIAFSITGKTWVNNHAHVLRFRNIENQRFIEFYLNSIKLDKYVNGMAQPKLNQMMLNSIIVPYPPLPEQKRIVAILDEAFAAIEKARTNAENNLANAREVFDSYLNSVFSSKGVGWEVKKLGDISAINYGYTESASSKNVGPKFLRITDIQNNSVNWDEVPCCKINSTDFKKYQLNDGDIVFARTGATTGKSYLVKTPPKAVFASYLIKVHLNNNILFPDYLYSFFQTKEYWDKINSGVSGSAQGGFNATKLAELVIPVPPLPEQKRIVAKLDELSAQTKRLEEIYKQKLADLDELKKSILQKAFGGEL